MCLFAVARCDACRILEQKLADGKVVQVSVVEGADCIGGCAYDGLFVDVETGVDDAGDAGEFLVRLDDFVKAGIVGFADILLAIGDFGTAVPTTVSGINTKTNEPVSGVTGFADILDGIAYFAAPPGPSANSGTSGACP